MSDNELAGRLAAGVEEVPDFPKPGVVYRDITPILQDPVLFHDVIDALAARYADDGIEVICGIEARGFIFGAALAYRLGLGFIPIRWPGKLPRNPASAAFELEYGFNALEVHRDALEGGKKVLLVDDLLGTGQTLGACTDLVAQAGGEVVSAAVVIEVEALEGRANLADRDRPLPELITLARI